MRIDPDKTEEFTLSKEWNKVNLEMAPFQLGESGDPKDQVARPFSGHERNRMFIQTENNFDDVSLISGADSRKDGRGFALLDFDRDGWLDLAVSSPNSPRLQLLRNTIGDHQQGSSNRSVYISLQGGNTQAKSSLQWSPRDGFGAMVLVTIGDKKKMYQSSCGEGLSVQNSKWIHVGLGDSKKIEQLNVVWPSGKKTTYQNVDAGSRVTLLENGEMIEH